MTCQDSGTLPASGRASSNHSYFIKLIAVTFEPGSQGALSEILGFAARAGLFLLILIIVVVTGAIAAGDKQRIEAALGGLSYGRILVTTASVAVWTLGIFAALSSRCR